MGVDNEARVSYDASNNSHHQLRLFPNHDPFLPLTYTLQQISDRASVICLPCLQETIIKPLLLNTCFFSRLVFDSVCCTHTHTYWPHQLACALACDSVVGAASTTTLPVFGSTLRGGQSAAPSVFSVRCPECGQIVALMIVDIVTIIQCNRHFYCIRQNVNSIIFRPL